MKKAVVGILYAVFAPVFILGFVCAVGAALVIAVAAWRDALIDWLER